MIGLGVSFIEFVLATFIPIDVGMPLLVALSNRAELDTRYLSAYALDLFFWFFFDTLNDAVQLEANEGYNFDSAHVGLVVLFIIGFLVFALVGGKLLPKVSPNAKSSPLPLAIVVALALGCHGIGEGIEFGGLAAGTQATNVLDAIGGLGGGVGYFLHKFLESMIVIVVFIALSRASGQSFRRQLSQTAMVGLAFGIPSAVGEVAGYLVPIDSTWFYALGTGAALFVVLQVIRPIFTGRESEIAHSQWVKISVAMVLGFLLLYAAALFHSS